MSRSPINFNSDTNIGKGDAEAQKAAEQIIKCLNTMTNDIKNTMDLLFKGLELLKVRQDLEFKELVNLGNRISRLEGK